MIELSIYEINVWPKKYIYIYILKHTLIIRSKQEKENKKIFIEIFYRSIRKIYQILLLNNTSNLNNKRVGIIENLVTST